MRGLLRTGIVLACLALVGVAAGPAGAASVSPRIVGGGGTTVGAHPWQVAVFYGPSQPICGGVVLDRWHVLTAAHCLLDQGGNLEPASSIFVLAGVSDLSADPLPGEQFVQAARLRPMPQYGTPPTVEAHDAGLITLSAPLTLGDDVAPATVTPPGAPAPAAGTTLTVTGWGYLSSTGPISPVLQEAAVDVVDDTACPGAFTDITLAAQFDPATMLCAIAPGRDSCAGDSGGPLTTSAAPRTLVGLVSWGPATCGEGDGPGVYAELAEPALNAFVLGPHVVGIDGPLQGAPGEQATFVAVVGDNDTPADGLRFTWDLDGDGEYDDADTGATPTVGATLPASGALSVGVRVSDDSAAPLSDTARRTVPVVVPPPVVNTNPPVPAPPAEPAAAPDVTGPRVTIGSLTRSGVRAALRLGCPGEASCHGVITLRTARRVATRTGRRTIAVGRAEFRLGWQEGVVRMRLNRAARRLLARADLKVAVTVVAFDAAGNRTRRAARATLGRR